jgi:hypothetical protein
MYNYLQRRKNKMQEQGWFINLDAETYEAGISVEESVNTIMEQEADAPQTLQLFNSFNNPFINQVIDLVDEEVEKEFMEE